MKNALSNLRINNTIDNNLFTKYAVKRGLRNANGTGVLVGLTKIGSVQGYHIVEGKKVPCDGKLLYRNIDLLDIVQGFQNDDRSGFEEVVFLLLFGYLPNKDELQAFNEHLDEYRDLPDRFTENMILKIPSKDIMNKIQRSILVLYSHDESPDDISAENLVAQSMKLIARLPTIIAYGYQAKRHYFDKKSLFIHKPKKGIGTAGNILHLMRANNQYTKTEKEVLDLLLVIHAEHGGGNNSTFTTSVISSTGTDTYSAISAAVGSLKGPKHGGANKKVAEMMNNIMESCEFQETVELKNYLRSILNKEANDQSGLIYGMGHAVYTISDPRANLLKAKAFELAKEKNKLELYELYADVEALTKILFKEIKGEDFDIAANTDLYACLVYQLLGVSEDLYTPLFAAARIAGWCAHRIEQILSDPKILRPAYAFVETPQSYCELSKRS